MNVQNTRALRVYVLQHPPGREAALRAQGRTRTSSPCSKQLEARRFSNACCCLRRRTHAEQRENDALHRARAGNMGAAARGRRAAPGFSWPRSGRSNVAPADARRARADRDRSGKESKGRNKKFLGSLFTHTTISRAQTARRPSLLDRRPQADHGPPRVARAHTAVRATAQPPRHSSADRAMFGCPCTA